MSRRSSPPKRKVAPDKKYNNQHITMFVNRMMRGGKRSTALAIMYGALDIIEERAKRDPIEVFEQAIRNVTPAVEVKPMRVGGSTYQVPVEVPYVRATSLAMRWLLETSRGRGGRNMAEKLSSELMDAAAGQGTSVKKKDDTHRMAEANRAFAHFR
ncbi:MAG: 30S ribosomal protein S7 [Anaerolineae bacterium]|nr:30S ribosomal protein S7 [Anaerolineae bacterium]MBN8618439.1 30S ribosomal protein S7 [Anaerolineae bacterium]